MEWEKIFAKDATDKGSIYKINKQLIQLNIKKKQTTQSKNGKICIDMSTKKIDGEQAHEKILNTAHYQRSVNQKHHEVSPNTAQNGYHPKVYK